MFLKIISGGQTGADRAALDFAIDHGIPHGGWCPAGRAAEDGPIDLRYQLTETPSEDHTQRTEWNVRDSDGTVVFSLTAVITGGSRETVEWAQKHGRPYLHVCAEVDADKAPGLVARFIREHGIQALNVAGRGRIRDEDFDERPFPKAENADDSLIECVSIVGHLKERIRSERGLTATIGIAWNKPLAETASDFEKPDGLTAVSERDKVPLLRRPPARALYRTGRIAEQVLRRVGIRTLGT